MPGVPYARHPGHGAWGAAGGHSTELSPLVPSKLTESGPATRLLMLCCFVLCPCAALAGELVFHEIGYEAVMVEHMLVLVPPTIYGFYYLVFRSHRPFEVHASRTVTIPPSWAWMYVFIYACYYIMWLMVLTDDPAWPPPVYPLEAIGRARAVFWNMLSFALLGLSVHLSAQCRSAIPVLLLIGIYPFIVPDRIPFSFQPEGCPNWSHHAIAACGLACTCFLLWRGGSLRVTLTAVPLEGRLMQLSLRPRRLSVPFEAVPLVSAAFSITYLVAVHWLRHSVAARALYHIAFSWLRPAYALLGACYWLKRFERLQLLQATVCGFILLYFAVIAPVATTHATWAYATCIHPSFEVPIENGSDVLDLDPGLKVSYGESAGPLGMGAHAAESTAFYLSWNLFLFHGLASGAWLPHAGWGGETAPRRRGFADVVAVLSVVAFLGVVVAVPAIHIAAGESLLEGDGGGDLGISYFGWIGLHYFQGYALIIVIEAIVILGCSLGLRRHRLSVEVHDEPQAGGAVAVAEAAGAAETEAEAEVKAEEVGEAGEAKAQVTTPTGEVAATAGAAALGGPAPVALHDDGRALPQPKRRKRRKPAGPADPPQRSSGKLLDEATVTIADPPQLPDDHAGASAAHTNADSPGMACSDV